LENLKGESMKFFFLLAFLLFGRLQCVHSEDLSEPINITTSLNKRSEERIQEITRILETNLPYNEQFYLYKELFTCFFQNYKDSGGSPQELSLVLNTMVALPKEEKEAYLKSIPNIFTGLGYSYKKLLELAESLALAAITYKAGLFKDAKEAQYISEGYKPYFLEILYLEEFLDCKIQGEALINTQILAINYMLQLLNLFISDFTFLNERPIAFYWDALVPSYHKCLVELDQREKFEDFLKRNTENKQGLFYIIFGREVTRVYSSRVGDDPISQFYPLVLKHGDLEFMKARFNQVKSKLKAWDKAFEWICLYIEGARLFPEKRQFFLEKAKQLTKNTLTTSWSNSDYNSWKEKEEEALHLIQEIEY
jgi:hypothetical protein